MKALSFFCNQFYIYDFLYVKLRIKYDNNLFYLFIQLISSVNYMSINNFDTNINSYTRDELIDMFNLPKTFNKKMVEDKEQLLRDTILNNNSIPHPTREATLQFLSRAKSVILSIANKANEDLSLVKTVLSNVNNSDYSLVDSKLSSTTEHMVQSRPEKGYTSSYPGEYFGGIINPLKKRTLIRNLNIDSRFRENYYSTIASNYNINLPIVINDVLDMQLAAIELPTTFYVISKQSGNNYFWVTLINNDGTFKEIVSVPDGNYTQLTIYSIINKELLNLATINADFGTIVFSINLSSATTGSAQTIVGFNGSQSSGAQLQLDFQANINGIPDKGTPLPLKFGWNLGFRNGIYIGNTNYVSEGLLDLTGPRYVYLVVDDFNNNVNNGFYNAVFNNSILNKNILARISLQSNTLNILEKDNFNIITYPRTYLGPVDVQKLQIQLLDEYGRILYLNNMDFSFCLKFTVVYDIN